ncbi:thaumatin-like protein 2 [Typha angustifolia]|uniref:thaumatin-like protein 2 n=1 Tax=Typha angustifolia TaxID=59011 RepID=UPI003C2D1C42
MSTYIAGTSAATLTLNNSCPYTIWPAISTNPGSPNPPDAYAGFELPSRALKTLDMPPAGWSGRAWARTFCAGNGPGNAFTCATGDCRTGNIYCGALPSPPVTFIELNLADVSQGNTNDSYQVSVAAGYNVPVSVVPPVGSGCSVASCLGNVNAVCPEKLRVVGDGGKVIACMSACQVFQDPVECCLGWTKMVLFL